MPRARRNGQTVPAQPFSDWLKTKRAQYDPESSRGTDSSLTPLSPSARLAHELGWGDTDAGIRRLYRFEHQIAEHTARSRTVRWSTTADTWSRSTVEDALHRYDPCLFSDLYPEFGEDVTLEPDAWCPFCEQWVTPVDGLCPWCVCDHGHLFREVGITEDGFACLACLADEQRRANRDAGKRRRAA